jgi:hypothetical protein
MKSQQKRTPAKKLKQPSKTDGLDKPIAITGLDGTTDILSSPITIGPIDMSSYYTATPTVGNITINSIGTSPSYTYASPTWVTSTAIAGSSNSAVNITGDGLVMQEHADIKIGNKSLKDFMSRMEERMAILVPDPKKLEQFEALRRAYEHYKLMEKLCLDKPVEEP